MYAGPVHKSKGYLASTLPHNLVKEKLTELIEQAINREGSLYLACNEKRAFVTSEQPKD